MNKLVECTDGEMDSYRDSRTISSGNLIISMIGGKQPEIQQEVLSGIAL
jgi:hypothetical protein